MSLNGFQRRKSRVLRSAKSVQRTTRTPTKKMRIPPQAPKGNKRPLSGQSRNDQVFGQRETSKRTERAIAKRSKHRSVNLRRSWTSSHNDPKIATGLARGRKKGASAQGKKHNRPVKKSRTTKAGACDCQSARSSRPGSQTWDRNEPSRVRFDTE